VTKEILHARSNRRGMRARAAAAGGRVAEVLRRRPRHAGVAAFVLGLLLSTASVELVAALAAVGSVLLARLGVAALGLLGAGILMAGAALGAVRVEAMDGRAASVRQLHWLESRAVLVEPPRSGRFGASAAIELGDGPAPGARVLARGDGDTVWPPEAGHGLEVAVAGEVEAPRTKPGADFDWPAHLRRRGIAAELRLARLRATGGRRGGALGVVDGIRRWAEEGLQRGVSDRQAALVRGMVLGQDEQIAPAVREDFRRTGLGHLLAVSGQNVMLLGALALPALAAAGVGPRGRVALTLGLIGLYVPLAGAGPSIQRAGVMGAAGLVALAASRPASRWYALLLAAAVTLAVNPLVAGEPGWQLSFAAVVGILMLGHPLRRRLSPLPLPLAEGIAVTVAATLATAPLVAHHFGVVSPAGLPANLLALPAVAPIMWLGMVAAAVAQLAALGPAAAAVAAWAGALIGRVNALPMGYLDAVARRFAEMPAELPLSLASPVAVACAYGALGLAALGARPLARRVEPRAASLAAEWRRLSRAHRVVAAATAIATLGGLAAWWWRPAGPPDRLTVSFLDVGQGDATLVQHPDGAAVLFDGGPPEARRAAAPVRGRQAPECRGRHPRLGRPPRRAGRGPAAGPHGGAGGRGRREPRPGVSRRAGRGGPAGRPPRARAGGPGAPRRGPRGAGSGSAAAAAGTGAGGPEFARGGGGGELGGLRPLSVRRRREPFPRRPAPPRRRGDEGPASRLEGPQPSRVLARLRPEVAVAEVGEGNGYGHPAPATLAALRAAGARVQRTDLDGTVTVTVEGGEMSVSTSR
jgi:competence protein ComEC